MTTTISGGCSQPGHNVRQARNGREGLNAVAEERPDLVLLDVEMPVVTGPEMAYALFMRNCGDEKIPIVLLSGIVDLDEIATMVGTPYFLGKPYAPEALMKTMERALKEQIAPRPKLEVRS